MHIIVPIKQVPETNNVKMDPETGMMIRSSVEGVINPLDLYAIEAALRLKEEKGGIVTVISMGPPKTENSLRDALAMGCDRAILLSDRLFGGSDTCATSYTLSMAIRKLAPFDLVICGERATDGETGQVGPGLAAYLNLPVITYVSQIQEVADNTIRLERLTEDGRDVLKSALPAVLVVIKEIGNPRLGTVRSKLLSRKAEIPVWGSKEIGAEEEWLGLKGSPTRVVKIYTPKLARNGQIVTAFNQDDLEKAGEAFIQFIKDKNLTELLPGQKGS